MAFPSSAGHPYILSNAWEGARQVAGRIKTQAANLRMISLAGPTTSSDILSLLSSIADAKGLLQTYAAVPGLAAYAQAQVNDNQLDVAASFSAMVARLDACRDWVIANFPKDGSGYLLAQQFTPAGYTADRTFDTASLAAFRTQLDLLIATID